MENSEFEKLVMESVAELPENIRKAMENVAIVIEEKPTGEQLKKTGIRYGNSLLGLYEGVPQTKWGKSFGMILPDKITIFKESIEKFAQAPEEIKELVKNTVWHEIGHHFGFDEKGVKKLESKWKKS